MAQILWIHLICDGPSDIVLGFEPKEDGIMDEKPRSLKEPILNHLGLVADRRDQHHQRHRCSVAVRPSLLRCTATPIEGRSIVFASFAVNSMVYIFAYRSMRRPLFRMNKLTANKPLIWAVLAGW